jgi:putative glycosyltransferase (TIGR04348 family)
VRFVVVTSFTGRPITGNRRTAIQWAEMLRDLGHDATVIDEYDGRAADALVALHASKSHAAVAEFQERHPGRVVVALTGTDIYPDPDDDAVDSMRRADRIVALQANAERKVPEDCRAKLRVIVQSAVACPAQDARNGFDVCVVGHLRAVKDPLRAAAAARLLPGSSRVRVRQAGAILEERFRDLVEREQAENPRYAWLGELDADETRRLIGGCALQVVSSRDEGGGRVIGESIVCGTPVLAARNDATECLLGADYPGLFEFGDTEGLAALMRRAESDESFLADETRALAAQFDPRLESEAWRTLVDEL